MHTTKCVSSTNTKNSIGTKEMYDILNWHVIQETKTILEKWKPTAKKLGNPYTENHNTAETEL